MRSEERKSYYTFIRPLLKLRVAFLSSASEKVRSDGLRTQNSRTSTFSGSGGRRMLRRRSVDDIIVGPSEGMRPESWRFALDRHFSATDFHGDAGAALSSVDGSVVYVAPVDVVVVLLLVPAAVSALLVVVVVSRSRTHLGETTDSSLFRRDGGGVPPLAFLRDIAAAAPWVAAGARGETSVGHARMHLNACRELTEINRRFWRGFCGRPHVGLQQA